MSRLLIILAFFQAMLSEGASATQLRFNGKCGIEKRETLISLSAIPQDVVSCYMARTSDALEGRLQSIENDIATNQRRIENLTARLADLPPEVSAEPIYKQIQEFTLTLKELERIRSDLNVKTRSLNAGVVDRTELLFRIKRTINALERVPAEDRRPIYANLIKFAELHPTKIRLGVYAPTVPAAHAAAASAGSRFQNVAGSRTVRNGSEGRT